MIKFLYFFLNQLNSPQSICSWQNLATVSEKKARYFKMKGAILVGKSSKKNRVQHWKLFSYRVRSVVWFILHDKIALFHTRSQQLLISLFITRYWKFNYHDNFEQGLLIDCPNYFDLVNFWSHNYSFRNNSFIHSFAQICTRQTDTPHENEAFNKECL